MSGSHLNSIKGIFVGIIIGFFMAGLLTGCGSTATTSTATSTGSGSGTTSDATLVTQQIETFKAALLAMDATTLAAMISSAYSESAPGGTAILGKGEFLSWLQNGAPPTILTLLAQSFSKLKINSITADLGAPVISGSVATVEGSLVVGTGTAEATLSGQTFTDLNLTYHFPNLSLRFIKESGTWSLAGFSAPSLALAYSTFGNSNPSQGGQAQKLFAFQLSTFKADASVTDTLPAAKPTFTSSNSSVGSSNAQFQKNEASNGQIWSMVIVADTITTDVDVAVSGLKSTSAAGGTSFSFTHKVDVGQSK